MTVGPAGAADSRNDTADDDPLSVCSDGTAAYFRRNGHLFGWPLLHLLRVESAARVSLNATLSLPVPLPLEAAQTVDKSLDGATRCSMIFAGAVEQAETCAKLGVQTLRAVPHDLEAAALRWSLWSEAGHDDVTPGAYDALCLRHIAGTIPCVGQEVKYGSVVPHGTGCGWQRRVEHVRNDPPDLSCAFA
jgi:hypothetical protein